MRSTNVMNKSPRSDLLAALAAAFASGLAAALLTLLVKLLDGQYVPIHTYVKYVLLAVASYSAVALLLHRLWPEKLRGLAPTWISTAFFGSILFVLIRLTPGIIGDWYDPVKLQSSLLNYILTEISAAKSVIVFLSLATIPISGVLYFVTYSVMNYRAKRISMS
jgi:hypothetical protein